MDSIATLGLWRRTLPPRRRPRPVRNAPFLVLLIFLVVIGIGFIKADPDDSGCRIKGTVGASGEHIYYLPTHEHYPEIVDEHRSAEQWFCSEWEAWFSGWRKAKG